MSIPNAYSDISKDEAIQSTDELYKALHEYGLEDDEVTSHKAGKRLMA